MLAKAGLSPSLTLAICIPPGQALADNSLVESLCVVWAGAKRRSSDYNCPRLSTPLTAMAQTFGLQINQLGVSTMSADLVRSLLYSVGRWPPRPATGRVNQRGGKQASFWEAVVARRHLRKFADVDDSARGH